MLNVYRNKVYEAGDREKMNLQDFCIWSSKITQFERVTRDEKRIPRNSFGHLYDIIFSRIRYFWSIIHLYDTVKCQ